MLASWQCARWITRGSGKATARSLASQPVHPSSPFPAACLLGRTRTPLGTFPEPLNPCSQRLGALSKPVTFGPGRLALTCWPWARWRLGSRLQGAEAEAQLPGGECDLPGLYPWKSTEVNTKAGRAALLARARPRTGDPLAGWRQVSHGGETRGALISGWRGPGV